MSALFDFAKSAISRFTCIFLQVTKRLPVAAWRARIGESVATAAPWLPYSGSPVAVAMSGKHTGRRMAMAEFSLDTPASRRARDGRSRAALGQLGDMDLRLLRVFKAVVECGGMSAAELELNIGSSTLSRHMKDLEERLGLTLCRRGRAGFALTPEGHRIYEATLQLLGGVEGFWARWTTSMAGWPVRWTWRCSTRPWAIRSHAFPRR